MPGSLMRNVPLSLLLVGVLLSLVLGPSARAQRTDTTDIRTDTSTAETEPTADWLLLPFASVGEVGPRIGSALFNGIETAVGLGGRVRFTDDGVHRRLDVAYSRTGVELYMALGEAF